MLLAALMILGTCAAAPQITASAAVPFDDNQVPIENRPESGSLHIFADDSTEEEVADPPSVLQSSDGTAFCSSTESLDCTGSTNLWFIAHLPVCTTAVTTDCIVGLTAQVANGAETSATFDRYFPNLGPQSYEGKPSINLPTGRAPGVWRIPGAPHAFGDEYAVVARLRGNTLARKAATFQLVVTPVSVKTEADTSPNYQMPHWVTPGHPAGPAGDRGKYRCAYWGENGSCLLGHAFPADTRFAVTVRLAVEPAGWLHGRINDPSITFTKDGTDTVVRISAVPVQVPAFQVARTYSDFPADVQAAFAYNGPYGSGGSRQPGGQYLADPAQRNAEYGIQAWKDQGFAQLALMTNVINDKAGWAPWLWRVRTLSSSEMSKSGTCLTSGDGLKGIVTTNATVYGSGPPTYNARTSTLTYKVAAPHYTRTGEVFSGTYDLYVRNDTARCLYDLGSDLVSVIATVVAENGSTENVTTSITEQDGWLKVSVSGFSHSAPTIKVAVTPADDISGTSKAVRLALGGSKTPAIATKLKRKITAATLVAVSGLSTAGVTRTTLVVPAKYRNACTVVGRSVRATGRGRCSVKVVLTTAAKKTRSATVILKIA